MKHSETPVRKLAVTFMVWTVILIFASLSGIAQAITWAGFGVLSGLTVVLAGSLLAAAWRHGSFMRGAAVGVAAVSVAQITVGAVIIQMNGLFSAIYLLLGVLNLGLAVLITAVTWLPTDNPGLIAKTHKFYFRSLILAGAGILLVLLTGTIVTGTGAGFACADWPLCRGEIFPAAFSLTIAVSLLHRFSVVMVGVLIAAVILQTYRGYKTATSLKTWAAVVGILFLAQVGVGGLFSLTSLPDSVINALHLGLTLAIWSSLVVMAAICYFRVETAFPVIEADEGRVSLTAGQRAKTYFKLTKPWILVLLLITTITAMVIAAEGMPSISLMLYTLLGGALSAGGASVLNSYIDSDIDQLMSRTSRRATAAGLVTPRETLLLGLTLSLLSFLIYAIFVNLLSAMLSTIGIIYYVFFYTLYLKRSTVHNIIIGGAAGAIPPLVGWTAVTNSLDLGAFYLFAIIFFWTPPHTWALALLVKKDYAKARVPMLPVVVGEQETTYQILLYTILLVTLTLLPFTFNMLSGLYLAGAVILGLPFIYLAWKLWRHFDKRVSKQLYKFSQAYLALLFLIMAVDRSLL